MDPCDFSSGKVIHYTDANNTITRYVYMHIYIYIVSYQLTEKTKLLLYKQKGVQSLFSVLL